MNKVITLVRKEMDFGTPLQSLCGICGIGIFAPHIWKEDDLTRIADAICVYCERKYQYNADVDEYVIRKNYKTRNEIYEKHVMAVDHIVQVIYKKCKVCYHRYDHTIIDNKEYFAGYIFNSKRSKCFKEVVAYLDKNDVDCTIKKHNVYPLDKCYDWTIQIHW
jgi:hypothetical protein